jgi:predicted nucleotidyltransferase component of viral defense system
MNLFDQLTREALRNTPDLGLLQPVVEKELLHHDILRELSTIDALKGLTFMGGTCLRACYGSNRLSEDLDFYGGFDFDRRQLEGFPGHIEDVFLGKYGLKVEVREPKFTPGNVDTWKVSIVTRPERPDFPAQRVHLDICALPSLDRRPMVLRNPYGVEMGTTGLVMQVCSREEILADKFVALALRRGRPKYRDLWDIQWLLQSAVTLRREWVWIKAEQHGYSAKSYGEKLGERLDELERNPAHHANFLSELKRFLSTGQITKRIDQPEYWEFLIRVLRDHYISLLSEKR